MSVAISKSRAWLTPDSLPSETLCHAVSVPDDAAWQAAFFGALLSLAESENWEQSPGGLDPEVVAERFLTSLAQIRMGCMYVGQVIFSAGTLDQAFLIPCDGRFLDPAEYPDLFTAIEYTFGGGPTGDFAIPAVSGRAVIGTGTGDGLTPRAIGDLVGSERVTLNTDQIPDHDHSIHSHLPGLAFAPGELPVTTPSIFPASTGGTGGGQSHQNMQPSIALNAYIVAKVF